MRVRATEQSPDTARRRTDYVQGAADSGARSAFGEPLVSGRAGGPQPTADQRRAFAVGQLYIPGNSWTRAELIQHSGGAGLGAIRIFPREALLPWNR
jgi:hypothetical protein